MQQVIKCPISNQLMESVFSEKILGKYDVNYYFCPDSGLLKTETPYWLEEAYQDAIADTDIGLVSRNIKNSDRLPHILYCLGVEKGKLVDVAGGYGLLTRLMRNKGFDCYTVDEYCQNIFARTFEPEADFRADAMFAFEVLEHIDDPVKFLSDIFSKYKCKTLICSTTVFYNEVPAKNWWYYSFETGQHITFYQPKTLSLLANKFGCEYFALGGGLHIITDIKLSKIKKALLLNQYLRKFYTKYIENQRKRMSKVSGDYAKMKNNLQKMQQNSKVHS